MKIIEEDRSEIEKDKWPGSPLTYRISIEISYIVEDIRDRLILKREYFYVGFNEGEVEDGFYFNNQVTWTRVIGITRATFITRKLDNKEYLIEKEKELIKLFYEELVKSEEKYKEELKEQTEKLNRNISIYQEYQKDEAFVKIVRKKKLKEIE